MNIGFFKNTFLLFILSLIVISCTGKHYTSNDGDRIFTSTNNLKEDPRIAGIYVEPPVTIDDVCWNVTDFDYQYAGISMDSYPKIDAEVYKNKFSRKGDLDFYLHPIICNGYVFDIQNNSDIKAYKLENTKVSFLWGKNVLNSKEKKNISISQARLDNDILYIVTNNGYVIAFDVVNKNILWKNQYDAIFNSSPTIYDGKIFLISERDDVFAIDKENGDVIWQYKTENNSQKAKTYQIPPVAIFQEKIVSGLSNGEVVVLNLDGSLIWKQKIYPSKNDNEEMSDIDFPPIMYNNVLVVGGNKTSVMGFDFKTGKPLWQIPTGLNSYMLLNNQGFGFFVSNDNENVCFIIENGLIKWVKPKDGIETTKMVGYMNRGKTIKTQKIIRYFDSY